MPHQCVRCSKIIQTGSKELLEGCDNCKSHFFFYVREEQLDKIRETPIVIPENEKEQIEKDVREMAGITEEDTPVILDLESVRVTGSGKFEIDIVNLFNKKRPLIYKLEEGKYIIDLASTLNKNAKDLKEIRDPRISVWADEEISEDDEDAEDEEEGNDEDEEDSSDDEENSEEIDEEEKEDSDEEDEEEEKNSL